MNSNVCSLREGKCKPCEGTIPKLERSECETLLSQLNDQWHLNDEGTQLRRAFGFKGFNRTMSFTNAIAWIANQEMHHPDLELGYNYCNVTLTTHAVNGLSENDFIMASKIDALLDE